MISCNIIVVQKDFKTQVIKLILKTGYSEGRLTKHYCNLLRLNKDPTITIFLVPLLRREFNQHTTNNINEANSSSYGIFTTKCSKGN